MLHPLLCISLNLEYTVMDISCDGNQHIHIQETIPFQLLVCTGFLAAPSSVTPSMALNSSGILIVNFFFDSAKVITAPL